MSRDYIPDADAAFDAWVHNFVTYVGAHTAELGLSTPDAASLTTKYGTWETATDDLETIQTSLRVGLQHRKAARDDLEQTVRAQVRRIQAFPTMTDEHRRGLGITVKDDTQTIPTATPPSRPMASVDTSQRLQHTIRFFDENTPRSRAKPAGVKGCEIWRKIGTAPADPCECQFLALDTASPYVVEYEGADAGKMAYYMLRWVSTGDEKGPWSETVAATIVG